MNYMTSFAEHPKSDHDDVGWAFRLTQEYGATVRYPTNPTEWRRQFKAFARQHGVKVRTFDYGEGRVGAQLADVSEARYQDDDLSPLVGEGKRMQDERNARGGWLWDEAFRSPPLTPAGN